MGNVGGLYYNGLGVDKDYTQAMTWNRKAADAGDSRAMYWIGVLYDYGLGVDTNLVEAASWYRKAAAGGNEDAKQWVATHGGNSGN
jgi:TPR repeat protein